MRSLILTGMGIRYLQFIPCIETDPATGKLADFSVTPEQYGRFLCRIFDRWYEYGPTKLSIRDFDSVLAYCISGKHTICTFDKLCADYIVVEHSGDCFPCDFFVDPEWRLGNILETNIGALATCKKKREFSRLKRNLCSKCLVCRHFALCRGGCMKDRSAHDSSKFDRESYLCEGYKMFFDHAMPKFMQIAATLKADRSARERPA
ncbi:MAG: SPASM domain-containing protein [Candidatus Brocadiia bacterium]|nr:MAG: SPASM domain-containing protein [Candidatus Brocadiia bacterium]